MELTLKEIEMLLVACNRVGQSPEVMGTHFKNAKAKLNRMRQRLLNQEKIKCAAPA